MYTATPDIYTLSLHDALPISRPHRDAAVQHHQHARARSGQRLSDGDPQRVVLRSSHVRSEEHTSELQSLTNLVCRLLLEKKNTDRPGTFVAVTVSVAAATHGF